MRFIFGNLLGIDLGKKPIDFGQGHAKVKVTSVKMTFQLVTPHIEGFFIVSMNLTLKIIFKVKGQPFKVTQRSIKVKRIFQLVTTHIEGSLIASMNLILVKNAHCISDYMTEGV